MLAPVLIDSGRRASVHRRTCRGALAVLAALVLAGDARELAAQPSLLPVDEAFRFAGRALDSRTLEANFTIANGYYLYRDKLSFVVEPGGNPLAPASLPPGKLKDDPFFGRVETYRDRLAIRLPLQSARPGAAITLRAEFQGCADAGVCYPPHSQRIALTLPAVDARPGPLIEATPLRKRWFN